MKFRKKRNKIKKIIQITLIAIVSFILIAGLSVYLLLHNYIHKLNLVEPDDIDTKEVETEISDPSTDQQEVSGNDVTQAPTDDLEKPLEAYGIMSTGKDAETESRQSSTDYYSQGDGTASDSQAAYNPYGKELQNTEDRQNSESRQSSEGQQSNESLPSAEQQQNQQNTEKQQDQAADITEAVPTDIPMMQDSQVINLLLIGSDTKSKKEGAKCDSVAIFTINRNTKKIITTTLLSNSYVQIPGEGKSRLTEAYVLGGADLLADTVEQNFRIKLDHYIMADYLTFINIVDTVGGVNVDVKESDLEPINENIKDINEQLGEASEADQLSEGRTYLFNGKQALAYSRSWYSSKGVFICVGKQKEIMLSIYDKIKQFNFMELNGFLNTILPQITTNFTEKQILEQIIMMPAYFSYDLEQCTIPVESSYKRVKKNGKTVLDFDYEKNITEIQRRLYNTD